MSKARTTVITAAVIALTPAVAAAHLGDYNTQLANATKACVARFDGCQYRSHTSGGAETHQRLFLFSRAGKNGQTCYQQYIVSHDNVVTDDVFQGCG